MKQKIPIVVISCGGTGGHISPGIAVYEALKAKQNIKVLFLLNDKIIVSQFLDSLSEEIIFLPEIKFSGIFFKDCLKFARDAAKTIWTLLGIFLKYKIKFMLSSGGGSSFLPVIMAHFFCIPSGLLEQNRIMGRANRIILPFVKRAYLSFPCLHLKKSHKMQVVGNPLRIHESNLEGGKGAVYEKLGLNRDRFTLLIMGGSQGAKRLNEWILKYAVKITELKKNIQIIHLTGTQLHEECVSLYTSLNIPFYCRQFCKEMNLIYQVSNLAVSRAGGGAIFELSYFGIPMILVPYPYAKDNHQYFNAEFCAGNHCAYYLNENDLFSDRSFEQLKTLFCDETLLHEMSARQIQFSKKNAASDISGDILKWIQ